MNSNVSDLIVRYRDKGILIDTNLLLVLLVGNVNPSWVGRVGKTAKYSEEDYELVRDILVQFNRFILIPQVLTETGNLIKRNSGNASANEDLNLEILKFVHNDATSEARVLSKRIVVQRAFQNLGYADAAIIQTAIRGHLIFTDDGPLQSMAWNSGVEVLPFDWLRNA